MVCRNGFPIGHPNVLLPIASLPRCYIHLLSCIWARSISGASARDRQRGRCLPRTVRHPNFAFKYSFLIGTDSDQGTLLQTTRPTSTSVPSTMKLPKLAMKLSSSLRRLRAPKRIAGGGSTSEADSGAITQTTLATPKVQSSPSTRSKS
jgi:hypothetical protein